MKKGRGFLEEFGRDLCLECKRPFLKEDIDKNGICVVCKKRRAAERKREKEYLESPQYEIDQENLKKAEEEKRAREEIERKDIEDNFYWFEGRCEYCQSHVGKFVNNLIIRPRDYFNCRRCGRSGFNGR